MVSPSTEGLPHESLPVIQILPILQGSEQVLSPLGNLLQATQTFPFSKFISACPYGPLITYPCCYMSTAILPSQSNLVYRNPLPLKSAFSSHLGNHYIHRLGTSPVPLFYSTNFWAFLSWCPNSFMTISRQIMLFMPLLLCNSLHKVGDS